MKARFLLISTLLILIAFGTAKAAIPPSGPFQVAWNEGPVSLRQGGSFNFSITIRVPEGYYLYADDTDVDFVALEGLIISNIVYPEPVSHEDPYIGKMVDIYKGDVVIRILGMVPETLDIGEHELVAELHFKGCSPTICFRPEQRTISFLIDVKSAVAQEENTSGDRGAGNVEAAQRSGKEDAVGFKDLLKITDFGLLLEKGIALTILIVFLAGVLTSLTPCVWPVIPAVLLFVGVHPHKKFWENVMLSAALVAGLSLVYSVLGIAAAALGKNFGFLFQQKWFLVVVVLFFVAMSLSMFGVFDLRLPMRWQRRMHELGGEGYRGSFLAGLGLGLVASPCAGPVLAALLGYVALQRSYAFGFLLLVVFSMGMGMLFIVLGACYSELAVKLRGGPWLVWIKRALGVALLFPAAFYMGSLFHWSGEPPRDEVGVAWIESQRDAFIFAKKTNRPIMMEFTADWCPPCHTLNDKFFKREEIVRLSYRLVPLKIDATVETNVVRRLIGKYKVMGWPSVIFLDPSGKELKDLRVNSYDPGAVEDSMREAVKRASKKWVDELQ